LIPSESSVSKTRLSKVTYPFSRPTGIADAFWHGLRAVLRLIKATAGPNNCNNYIVLEGVAKFRQVAKAPLPGGVPFGPGSSVNALNRQRLLSRDRQGAVPFVRNNEFRNYLFSLRRTSVRPTRFGIDSGGQKT